MLKKRVITACVLGTAFLAILFIMPVMVFSLAMGGALLLAAWEWSNLAGFKSMQIRVAYVISVAALSLLIVWFTNWTANEDYFRSFLILACCWWAFSLLWIQSFPASAALWGSRFVRALMGFLVLIPAWLSLIYLRNESSGAILILLVVLIVASADIGAYFTGRAFGRIKLAPAVSPGKTWEGVIGGVILSILLAAGFNLTVGAAAWVSLFAIVIPTALVSVIGDLVESMVKRHRGVKDSGTLLPGHGGVLDRIDGLVAAMPIFALALILGDWRIS